MAALLALAAGLAFLTGLVLFHLGMLAFVRSGSERKVPDVVGREISTARERLQQMDFTAAIEREIHSAEFGEGRVVEQRPEAGAVLRRGRKVWLTTSLGLRKIAIPNLVGLSYRQAAIALGREQLTIGSVSRLYHEDVPRGSVIAHDPPAGSSGAEGARVDLLVSLGEPLRSFVLPRLVGRSARDAETLLASHGIRVGEKTVLIDRSVLPSTVLEHDPAPGSRVFEGEEVDLVVSSRR